GVEYGCRGGLVPGVTVYGYMAAAAMEHFGLKWLDRGAMDIRFLKPVYEGEQLIVTVEAGRDGRVRINAGESASADAWIHSGAPSDPPNHTDAPVERRGAARGKLLPGVPLSPLVPR